VTPVAIGMTRNVLRQIHYRHLVVTKMSLSNIWKDVDSVCHAAAQIMVMAQSLSKDNLELQTGGDHHMACKSYVMSKDGSTSLELTHSVTYIFNISRMHLCSNRNHSFKQHRVTAQ